MPLIDFDVDIRALWAGGPTVNGEEPYAQGAIDFPDRYDDASEERILIMMDIMRAYLETLTRRDELQRFHHAMSRILGEVAYNRVYDDLGARTSGNVAAPATAGPETAGVDVIAPDGTVAVQAPAAVGVTSDLPTLVAAINGLGGWPAEVEAYADGNKLGFRLTAAGEAAGSSFELTGTLIALAGLRPGPHVIPVRAAARRARDKGLDHFHREIRDDNQP